MALQARASVEGAVSSSRLVVMGHWLFLPDDAIKDVAILASLSQDRLSALRGYLDSTEFRPRYGFYVKVADLLGISDEAAANFCTFINHVNTQRMKLRREVASIPAELESFLSRVASAGKSQDEAQRLIGFVRANRTLIANLFADLPERDFSAKVRGLETGPLPHLHAFRTFCDVRPVFDDKADGIIQQFPILTLSLVTHCTATDRYEQVVVQLTEADLTAFRDAFARLDKKLKLIKQEQEATDSKKGEG
jgi:hypothetical protein